MKSQADILEEVCKKNGWSYDEVVFDAFTLWLRDLRSNGVDLRLAVSLIFTKVNEQLSEIKEALE